MKKTRKIIAILLTVLTLLSVISAATPVFAEEVTELTETNSETFESAKTENAEEQQETENEPEILNEVVEWRTESTKYFRNSDGSYTAAQYAYPIHYKENGEWKEIDNSLKEKTVGESLFNPEKNFVTKNTNTPASFPEKFKQDGSNKITVTVEDYKISFSPKGNKNGIKNSNGKVKDREDLDSVKIVDTANENQELSTFKLTLNAENEATNSHKKNEKFKVKNNSGAVVYENVFNNVNLEYELNNSKLKESIVLNEKQEEYMFSFNMDLGSLYPVMCDNGSINLCSDKGGKNPVAKIEAPYMVDSLGEYSDSVTMSIEENENIYILTVTADEAWLNDNARVYPVVIDPTIRLDINAAHTYDCYVDDSEPDTALPYDTWLYVGNNSLGKTQAFVKFELPDLPGDNYLITNASIAYYQYELDPGNGSAEFMSIHKLTEDWDNEDYDVTWNNKPYFDPNVVLDYAKYDQGASDELYVYKFDVTRTVKEWYEGAANYGFALKLKDETATKRARLVSAEHPVDDYYPSIYVTFLDNKGLESYWSYSSFGIGVAGTAHINDYTGNLVYELPIASSISEKMPVSIVGYYNNYCANELISETEAKDVRTSIGRGFRLIYQQTVLPSTKYGLTGKNAEKYPYVYTDGDGTEHYIQKVTEDGKTVYKDEDGLGLTLTTELDANESGTYKITDKAHNKYYFNIRGNLFRIVDNNGNKINIQFKDGNTANNLLDKSRIDKIIDGAGHTYTFKYYVKSSTGVELDYVESITDNAGRTVNFNISGGLLDKVSYYNGDSVDIVYENTTEGIINYIQSNKSYRINFDYTSISTGRRVKKVKEYGVLSDGETVTDTENGQVITFDRSKYNTTIMRSCGLDGKHVADYSTNGDDDIITTIQFDNMGRAISQQMKFGSGAEIGAGSVAYTSTSADEAASGFKNKVSGSGATGKYVENLLYSGNAEEISPWAYATVGTLTATTAETTTSTAYMGKNSLKLNISKISTENARCYYRQALTGISAGDAYTLSGYVKTSDLTKFSNASLTGAFLELDAYNSSGTLLKSTTSQVLTSKTDTEVNKGWRRLSTTITVPENTATLRVYLVLRNVTGTAYFDCIQLEKGSTVNDFNMLENSHFTKKSTNTPTSWSKSGDLEFSTGTSVANGVVVTENAMGNNTYAMKITGEPDALNAVAQTVAVEGNPNDTYILSGWGKANAVNSTYHTALTKGKDTETTDDDEYSETALFEIGVRVNYSVSDGTTHHQYKPSAKFNTTISDWQCASVPIVLKCTDGESSKTYTPTSIRVILKYKNQENIAYFDKIMLVKDAASSYTYDKDGNLVSASSNSEQKSNMEYNDANNLTSYTDSAGFKTELSYEENTNNLNYTKSAKGVYTNYDYDSYGNVTSADVRNKGKIAEATAVIKTTNGYNVEKELTNTTINEGAYRTSSTDSNGNTTHYTNDYATGTLTKVKNAKNVETTYEYYPTTNNKNFGKQKSITTGNSKVTYEYNGKQQLNKIIFGNTTKEEYYFEYDAFGNITQTKVGSQPLCINTFKPFNGVLEKTEYGNGDSRRYSYNNFGQKIVDYVTDDGTQTKAYSWAYNDSGISTRHTDYINRLQYLFDYDSLGRISKEEVKDYDTGSFVGYTEYGYDVRNNLTKLITNYGGKANTQRYYYSTVDENENSANYRKDNLPTKYKLYSSRYAIYDYDGINRLNQRKFTLDNTALYYNYIYKLSDRNAENEKTYKTTQVAEEYIGNDVYIYDYDVLGNITSIRTAERKSTVETEADFKEYINDVDYVEYSYDDLGQLTRENLVGKNTTVWNYDELGNIITKSEYDYTTESTDGKTAKNTVTYYYKEDDIPYREEPETTKTYTSWNNLLLSIDLDGSSDITEDEVIEYDEIGNPEKYLGASLSWNGRQLTSYTTADKTISYKYDSNGLRTSKTVNGVTSKYFYVNGKLHYEERSDGTKLYFYYDSNDYLTGIEYNGNNLYTATNLRGDVLAIYKNTGECIARYEYDAWGNVISVIDCDYYDETQEKIIEKDITNDLSSTDIAMVNPIRYRGYYYDSETGLYYLQSRYYNPEVGRFLNADSLLDQRNLLGYNMFNYCSNNPVNKCDPTGHLPEWLNTIVDKALDVIIDIGKKSPFSSVRAAAYAADYVKTMDSARKGGMSAENKVEEAKRIQQTYTNDIFKVHNNEELTETADPICFPDLEEYKQLCESGYDKVQRVFPEDSFSDYTTSDIAAAIGSWDEETTTYIGRVTGLRVVVEDVLLNMMP